MAHDYSNRKLSKLIETALQQWADLANTLHAIQEYTGIPGLHTNINSNDLTPGVLERIQDMHDSGEAKAGSGQAVTIFQSFDEDEEVTRAGFPPRPYQ